jgi:hypothetical protein
MINTGGSVYHNNVNTATNNLIKFENREVTVKIDVPNKEIEIDGVKQKMGDNLPNEVYFVIAINTPAEKVKFKLLE